MLKLPHTYRTFHTFNKHLNFAQQIDRYLMKDSVDTV